MNRRGFIKGLGALLATTAIVRPALPEPEAVTNAIAEEELATVYTVYFQNRMYWMAGNSILYWSEGDPSWSPVSPQTVDETVSHETPA